MPPVFRSQIFKFNGDVLVPAHLEPGFSSNSIDRDRAKYSLLQELEDADSSGTDIIAWDIDSEADVRLLAEARYQHVRSLGVGVKLHCVMPGGAGFSVPPKEQA